MKQAGLLMDQVGFAYGPSRVCLWTKSGLLMDQVGFADGPGAGANQEQAGLIPDLYNFSHVHFDLLLRCFVVLPCVRSCLIRFLSARTRSTRYFDHICGFIRHQDSSSYSRMCASFLSTTLFTV